MIRMNFFRGFIIADLSWTYPVWNSKSIIENLKLKLTSSLFTNIAAISAIVLH